MGDYELYYYLVLMAVLILLSIRVGYWQLKLWVYLVSNYPKMAKMFLWHPLQYFKWVHGHKEDIATAPELVRLKTKLKKAQSYLFGIVLIFGSVFIILLLFRK